MRKVVNINTNIGQSEAMKSLLVETKLSVNHKLFEKGYITEEMYVKAKELIISADTRCKKLKACDGE